MVRKPQGEGKQEKHEKREKLAVPIMDSLTATQTQRQADTKAVRQTDR